MGESVEGLMNIDDMVKFTKKPEGSIRTTLSNEKDWPDEKRTFPSPIKGVGRVLLWWPPAVHEFYARKAGFKPPHPAQFVQTPQKRRGRPPKPAVSEFHVWQKITRLSQQYLDMGFSNPRMVHIGLGAVEKDWTRESPDVQDRLGMLDAEATRVLEIRSVPIILVDSRGGVVFRPLIPFWIDLF